MNNTYPTPYTHSVNFNMPNINRSVPLYGQTPIPMNPMTQEPLQPLPMVPISMPFGHPIYTPYQPDIINKYNVNISTGNLGYINHIYQDMLPKNNSIHDSYATIVERLTIANYYELIFNKNYNQYEEFKNMITDKISDTNLSYLLGHIKLDNINSYYSTKDTNPVIAFATAPPNFFMFNVCSPIVYENNNIKCAENRTRAQLRIYKLFNIDTTNPNENKALNKIAFELLYYKKIQDFIKIHKYPNFVLSYGHIVAPCKMDFDNINKMKNIKNLYYDNTTKENKCLLILTESVNYNIIEWATKQYEKSENNNIFVSKVINTGVRSVEAWKSVIFQLLIAIYILHSNTICFKNFTLENNVFIKKIGITPPEIRYWKYIIDGAEYYVPNHGFLVMIDSNFIDNNDIIIHNEVKKQIIEPSVPPAPAVPPYNYNTEITDKDINTLIFNIFNNLTTKTHASITIPDGIINTISNIKNITNPISSTVTSIKDIINNVFKCYLYEKLGHMITDTELNEYKLNPKKDFKTGDLVFYKKYTNVYIISAYKDSTATTHQIYTNNVDIDNYDEDKIDIENLDIVTVTEDLITKFHYKSNNVVIETYYIK